MPEVVKVSAGRRAPQSEPMVPVHAWRWAACLDVSARGRQGGQPFSPAELPIFWQWDLIFLGDLPLSCFHLFSRNDVKLRPGPMECHGWVLEWT